MTTDQMASLVWFAGAFLLVLSSLAVRRIPLRDGMKMALIWVMIFVALFMAVRAWQGGQAFG
ncbi:MAG: hypothetical protein RLZZ58_588 [Pseudomonadota bacterium]|jgi:hypothetical protein